MKTHPAVHRHLLRVPSQKGFTLIELIVVLVILGILAAFAIPRFANVNNEARQAAIRGLAGSLRSSAALVHGLALARGVNNHDGVAANPIALEGVNIEIVNGYPAASAIGIQRSVLNLQGFTPTVTGTGAGATVTFVTANAPAAAATCQVVYTAAAAGGSAEVTLADTNCN